VVGNPLLVVHHDALDGAAGEAGGGVGEIVEGECGGCGEGDGTVGGGVVHSRWRMSTRAMPVPGTGRRGFASARAFHRSAKRR
jgi:hypothetical protein